MDVGRPGVDGRENGVAVDLPSESSDDLSFNKRRHDGLHRIEHTRGQRRER